MLGIDLSAPALCGFAIVTCCLTFNCGCAHLANHDNTASSASHATLHPSTLIVTDRVSYLDTGAKEPMIVEHPSGALFVSGYGADPRPHLWKSLDHGKTWTRVNVGSEAEGAIGNSDVDLAMAADGTLYFASLLFVDREGKGVSIGVSRDVGITWRWTALSRHQFDDRPWIAVAADGTAHVIWNDGSGVNYAVSQDRGVTWTQRPRIYAQGGSSHLAVGPHREVAARVTPLSKAGGRFDAGIDLIAVSVDGGATWKTRPAPGHREWFPKVFSSQPRWVEPLAWDAQGALYSFWADGKELWLARSLNRGETWTNWLVASGDEVSYYPYLAAQGRGELAATWLSGLSETVKAHVARIEIGNGAASPKIVQLPAFSPDTWAAGAKPEDPLVRSGRAGGEYMPAMFLRTGGLAVVSPIIDVRQQRIGFSWLRIEAR